MRRNIIILIVFITSKVFCQSHFPDSNAIWNVNVYSGALSNEVLYGIKGDTLINDTLYNKLYTLSDTTLSNENLQVYIGGFRREGKKVWFKPAYWTPRNILLYDFSASEGDTVWYNGLAYYGAPTFEIGNEDEYGIIQEINVVNNIKTYSVIRSDGFYDEWYENIGSSFGLFGSIIRFPLTGDTYNLACFKHNDTVKYQSNLKCNKCFCNNLSGIDKKNSSDWVNIFPNPTQNLLTIKVRKAYSNIVVEIINEKGNVVYKADKLYDTIKLDDLSSGVYFVKLLVDDEIIVKKIIK